MITLWIRMLLEHNTLVCCLLLASIFARPAFRAKILGTIEVVPWCLRLTKASEPRSILSELRIRGRKVYRASQVLAFT